MIQDKVFYKLRVSVYRPVNRKKVFLKSSPRIETHIDVVVEVLRVQSSVYFEFYVDEEFVEYWQAGPPFIRPRLEAREWISVDIISHPDI